MIKITVINGSPRKNGATASLLKMMVAHLNMKKDIDVTYYNIIDFSLKSCTGCMSCYNKGICCLDDEVEVINKNISESDGIIIGAPTYSSNMPGSLKTFIDRGHFVVEQALSGKYTFALSTYEISGGGHVLSELKNLFQCSGGIVSGSFSYKLPFNTSPFENPKIEKKIIAKTEKYYNAIVKRKSKSLINRIINRIALHVVMKPEVLKRTKQYKAVIERWKALGVVR